MTEGISVFGQPNYQVRSYSTLLEVRVFDRRGLGVHQLRPGDFEIKIDGKLRKIVFFEESKENPVSVVILVDVGSNSNEEQVRTAKEAIFQLIHILQPEDQIALAVYARETDFLAALTSDRLALVEALENLAAEGRSNFWARMGRAFGSDALTGRAVDDALLHLKKAQHEVRIVLAFSAAFGNLGPGTEEHLAISGARFFGVGSSNRLGDIFNLWGDRASRGHLLEKSAGAFFSGNAILERVDELRDAMKHHYLIAFAPDPEDQGWEDPDIRVHGNLDYRATYLRRKSSSSVFY